MEENRERPQPIFRRPSPEQTVSAAKAIEDLPEVPLTSIAKVPDDTPEWLFIAARCLVAKHIQDSPADRAKIRYEEWVRLLSSFRLGLLAAYLPDWVAQSLIMGVLDHNIGHAVETLIRAVPHMAHAAIKGKELNETAAWRTQLRDRAFRATKVVTEGIRTHRPVDAVLERAEVELHPQEETE